MTEKPPASGVQELIEKLSQDGVAEGQRQADELIRDAQRRAGEIIESARREAKQVIENGRSEVAQYQAAGEEALRLATRDTIREFGSKIHEGYRNRLQELVGHQMKDPQLIRQMILEITRQGVEGSRGEAIQLILPKEIISEDEARRRIEEGDQDALIEFIYGLLGEDLRELPEAGLRDGSGMVVRLVDGGIEIDLTEESITEMLARHMLPRFRAIMRQN